MRISVFVIFLILFTYTYAQTIEYLGGLEGTDVGYFNVHIRDIAVNSQGEIYIAIPNRIIKRTVDGQFERVAGKGVSNRFVDGNYPDTVKANRIPIDPVRLVVNLDDEIIFTDSKETGTPGIWLRKLQEKNGEYYMEKIAGTGAPCYSNLPCLEQSVDMNVYHNSLPFRGMDTPIAINGEGMIFFAGSLSAEGYEGYDNREVNSILYAVSNDQILHCVSGKQMDDPGIPSRIPFRFDEIIYLQYTTSQKLIVGTKSQPEQYQFYEIDLPSNQILDIDRFDYDSAGFYWLNSIRQWIVGTKSMKQFGSTIDFSIFSNRSATTYIGAVRLIIPNPNVIMKMSPGQPYLYILTTNNFSQAQLNLLNFINSAYQQFSEYNLNESVLWRIDLSQFENQTEVDIWSVHQ